MFGSSKVWETYVLPFTTTVNYVIGVNSEGNMVDIEDHMRDQGGIHVKQFPKCVNDKRVRWFATLCYHPVFHTRATIRTGGIPVQRRLMDRIGVTPIIVNVDHWENMTDDEKQLLIKTCIGIR